jgi:hypothetical protein
MTEMALARHRRPVTSSQIRADLRDFRRRISEGDVGFWHVAKARSYLAQVELPGAERRELEDLFSALLESFATAHGTLESAYFCTQLDMAAALTREPMPVQTPRWRQFASKLAHRIRGRGRPDARPKSRLVIHVSSLGGELVDWSAKEVLLRCTELYYRASEYLSPPPLEISVRSTYAIITTTLGLLDRRAAQDVDLRLDADDVRALERQLDSAAEYYKRTVDRNVQIDYTTGMLSLGAVILAVTIAIPALFGVDVLDERLLLAIAAGSVGAVVSVLQRATSGSLRLSVEQGRAITRTLGAMRPIIGGLFGACIYVLASGDVIEISASSPSSYAALGFLAGFTERFAQDMLVTDGGAHAPHSASHLNASSTELIARVPEAIHDSVRSALLGPDLVNWSGFVAASVDYGEADEPARSESGIPVVTAGAQCAVVVTFAAVESGSTAERPIDIRDGTREGRAVFQIRADSDTIALADDEVSVPVGDEEPATARIAFRAPAEPGGHRIWVHVTQRNRTVQVVPLELLVPQG